MRFSVESLARPISLTAVAVAVVGTGVAAERVVPPPYGAADWVPDLLVGLVVAGAGLLATALRRTSWTGPLLLLAGVAWFVPNFAHTGPGWLAAIAAACVFLHRGLLTHAVLAYPTGRPSSLRSLLVIATVYAASVSAAAWQHAIVAIVLVSAVVVTTTFDYRAAAGTGRRARLPAVAAAGLFALVVVVESLIRGAVTTRALLTGYQLAVVAVAGVLSAGLLVATAGRDEVTDLVVELGRGRSGSLRDRLAIVLGDPSLQVGYWIPIETADDGSDTQEAPIVLVDRVIASGGRVLSGERGFRVELPCA